MKIVLKEMDLLYLDIGEEITIMRYKNGDIADNRIANLKLGIRLSKKEGLE